MTIKKISKKLKSSLEARMLVKHITILSDTDLIGADDIEFNETQKKWLEDAVEQRLSGRPISKIIGVKEFYGRDFMVNDDVLDPRPDSEILIDVVLNQMSSCGSTTGSRDNQKDPACLSQDDTIIRILDLGVGSGCLILTLLAQLPNATGVAVDVSDMALVIAKQNAEKLGVSNRIEFIQSDWFESVEGMFDIIVSNPPYINSDIVPTLDKNVREFDPVLALDGGKDGLDPYKIIIPQAKKYLNVGGVLVVEHGYDQCGRIEEIFIDSGFESVEAVRDLAGHDRVLMAIHK